MKKRNLVGYSYFEVAKIILQVIKNIFYITKNTFPKT